ICDIRRLESLLTREMGFRRSLVRIQSPRHHKTRQDFEFWRVFLFVLETALQETLQETHHFSANFRQFDAGLLCPAALVARRFKPSDPDGPSCSRLSRTSTCTTPEKSCN